MEETTEGGHDRFEDVLIALIGVATVVQIVGLFVMAAMVTA